jgi:hypothetical protein
MAFFINRGFWGTDFDFDWAGSASAAANPQLQFFENFPGHLGGSSHIFQNDSSLHVHAINIPLSLSFNYPVILFNKSNTNTDSVKWSLGLYSLTGSTLSLANLGSFTSTYTGQSGQSWHSFITSATQNITPGTWYLALLETNRPSGLGFVGNSSINPGNAIPGGFLMGRLSFTVTVMPASIATSDFDITGSDAIQTPYVIITA